MALLGRRFIYGTCLLSIGTCPTSCQILPLRLTIPSAIVVLWIWRLCFVRSFPRALDFQWFFEILCVSGGPCRLEPLLVTFRSVKFSGISSCGDMSLTRKESNEWMRVQSIHFLSIGLYFD
ncbi:hypothetical protein F2Q69_00048646 [Brassica cretica]|uniref:Uncharacterized protein n=1 Tax=Brassica cretica TaxID=69181 RepID=A0A8S9PSB5_BRACR|nr:hypothetical protein F2Q69_00048646 [Brassica cretica]